MFCSCKQPTACKDCKLPLTLEADNAKEMLHILLKDAIEIIDEDKLRRVFHLVTEVFLELSETKAAVQKNKKIPDILNCLFVEVSQDSLPLIYFVKQLNSDSLPGHGEFDTASRSIECTDPSSPFHPMVPSTDDICYKDCQYVCKADMTS